MLNFMNKFLAPLAAFDADVISSKDITDVLGNVCAAGTLLLAFSALVLYAINKSNSQAGNAVSENAMIGCVLGAIVFMAARTFITGVTLF